MKLVMLYSILPSLVYGRQSFTIFVMLAHICWCNISMETEIETDLNMFIVKYKMK